MALPEGLTEAEVERYEKLDSGIKKLQEEHKVLGDKIKEAYAKKGTYVVNGVVMKITETSRLDSKLATDTLPFDGHSDLYEPKISSALVKKILPEEEYAPLFTTTLSLSVSKAE